MLCNFGHRNILLAMILFFLFSIHPCLAAEQKLPGRTTIDLYPPPPGIRLTVDPLPKDVYVLHFDPAFVDVLPRKDDLVFIFEDGAEIVFVSVYQKPDTDKILLEIDGNCVLLKDVLEIFLTLDSLPIDGHGCIQIR